MNKERLSWEDRETLREKRLPGRPRIYAKASDAKIKRIVPKFPAAPAPAAPAPAAPAPAAPAPAAPAPAAPAPAAPAPAAPAPAAPAPAAPTPPAVKEKTQQEKDIDKYLDEIEKEKDTPPPIGITEEDLKKYENGEIKASDMIDANAAVRMVSDVLNLWRKRQTFDLTPQEEKILRNNVNALLDEKVPFIKGKVLLWVTIINFILIFGDKFIKDAEIQREKIPDNSRQTNTRQNNNNNNNDNVIQENNGQLTGEYALYSQRITNAEQNNNNSRPQGNGQNNPNQKANT